MTTTAPTAPRATVYDAPYTGIIALTPGATTAAQTGQGFGYLGATAGTATVTFYDSSTVVLPFASANTFYILPWAVTGLTLGSGGGTFVNLLQ